jgi:hypothetical protein
VRQIDQKLRRRAGAPTLLLAAACVLHAVLVTGLWLLEMIFDISLVKGGVWLLLALAWYPWCLLLVILRGDPRGEAACALAGDPRCEVMRERVALEHPWPVKRYVVIPPGFSVKGTVRVRDRWPEVSTRNADSRDRYAWSYRFQPRNGKPLAALSGEFSF